MRNALIKTTLVLIVCVFALYSCRKNAGSDQTAAISDEALAQIYNLGFSNKNVTLNEDGDYVVEGDIVLSKSDLTAVPSMQFFRVGEAEQYRTTNLVKGLPRVINVSISSDLPASYVSALDVAIGRYNALNLQITFQRVSTGAAISIVKGNGNFLASAGFPTSAGSPYNQIKVNSRAIGNQPQNTVASILAHEMGHCIGFRHTDYMDRSFSCGGAPTNEGASTVGAVLIPGTPSAADAGSWMLSCIGSGDDRPFNGNDQIALNYLY
jgi:hypothetical protein